MSRFFLLISLIWLMIGGAIAGTIKVPADYATIQAGIDAAANGDTVLVADGMYFENINFKGKAITVASNYLVDSDTTHINNTIIDGSQPSHPDSGSVVYFISGEDTTSVICGITITNGSGTRAFLFSTSCKAGGGIYCYNAGCKLLNNKIINNSVTGTSAYGGGIAAVPQQNSKYVILRKNQIIFNTVTASSIFASGGGAEFTCNIILTNNTISHNACIGNNDISQTYSGGVDFYTEPSYSREIHVIDNKITHNSVTNNGASAYWNSALGGGMCIWKVTGTIRGNEICNNELWPAPDKSSDGAGIMVGMKTDLLLIEKNIIRDNACKRGIGYGGGIEISDAKATLRNNIIYRNISINGGGAVIGSNSAVEIINNTIIHNTATTGGGIWVGNATSYFMNTIIWANQANLDSGIHLDSGAKNTTVYSNIQGGWSGTGNINADPLFADTIFHLSNASPCLGTGTKFYNFGSVTLECPAEDLEGNSRPNPQVSNPDMGALESPRSFPKSNSIREVPAEYATIQAGIDAATNGDTILVANGTYFENINFKGKAITVASYFLMDSDTTHINATVINGSQPGDACKGSVVSFTSGEDTTSVICGFTITGGTGTLYNSTYRIGGGIYCRTSGARISHNKIVFNTINHTQDCDGGGIGYWPISNSTARYVIIENNVIESNSIASSNRESYISGGGIFLVKGRITGNTIRYNSVSGQPIFSGGGGIEINCEDTSTRTLAVIAANTITHNKVYAPGNQNLGGGWGGGVDVVFANVQLINNIICYNEAGGNWGQGAGVRLWKSKEISVIKDNIISFNSMTKPLTLGGVGGGLRLWEVAGVTVQGNTFEGNMSDWGGAIFESDSPTATIIDNRFIDNHADSSGGAIYCVQSSLKISNNSMKQNHAKYGGAILSYAGIYRITNNIMAENKAHMGGGIFCIQDSPSSTRVSQIINNTITANVADSAGAMAIHYGKMIVLNTICWGNSASHGPEILMWGGTLDVAHSDIHLGAEGITIDSAATVNWFGDTNIDADPEFTDSLSLQDSSPCIGKGVESFDFGNSVICACPVTDKAGNARPDPVGSNPDIGAYESPLVTEVENSLKTEIPQAYLLDQNYPNPFNPTTTISYQLPKISQVDVSIYNTLGQKVATLVSENQPAGFYTVHWDAMELASGVYLYRLEAGEFVQVKKLILLR